MAGFITFETGLTNRTWSSTNWVFNSFLDHIIFVASDQSDLVDELTICKYHQNVDLEEIARENAGLHTRIISAFSQTARRIAQGDFHITIEDRELADEESRQQYQQAINDLALQLGDQLTID